MKKINQQLKALEEIPEYADVFEMKEFIQCCKCGGFIDYDGYGHPAVNNLMNEDILLKPSEILEDKYDKRFTHMVWFNR